MNAGTEGPLPRAAADAVRQRIEFELDGGRSGTDYFDSVRGPADELRAAYARVLHVDPSDLALTGSTTDGCNTILSGLDLRAGDQVVTSDEEHPGLLAPLGRLKRAGGDTRGAPGGGGPLSVRRDQLDELTAPWPGYASLADAKDALNSGPAQDAARLDHG